MQSLCFNDTSISDASRNNFSRHDCSNHEKKIAEQTVKTHLTNIFKKPIVASGTIFVYRLIMIEVSSIELLTLLNISGGL